jgi:hypothetical protein
MCYGYCKVLEFPVAGEVVYIAIPSPTSPLSMRLFALEWAFLLERDFHGV